MKKFGLLIVLLICISLIPIYAEESDQKLYYWNFNGHGRDYSKENLDIIDYQSFDYSEGIVSDALDITDGGGGLYTDVIDCVFEAYTMAAWVYLDEGVPQSANYQIVMAKDKKVPGHFEIFFMQIGDQYQLKVYTLELGDAVAVEDPLIDVGQWLHIAATYDGKVQKLYLNGQEAFSQEYDQAIDTSITNSVISFGSLVEGGLDLYGKIDEAILANYAFDAEMIAHLHDNPKEAANSIMEKIKETYPEGETPRPDETPTPEPTPEPTPTQESTKAPETTAPSSTSSKDKSGKKSDNSYLIPVIIGATVVIAAVIMFIIFKPKKKS